jgi:antitoxin VapB
MPIASEKIPADAFEAPARHVRLFRNGANQAVRIPKEFELPGKEAFLRREGNRLIIEPLQVKTPTLAELMNDWEDMDEPFPDVDEGLLPLDDIEL